MKYSKMHNDHNSHIIGGVATESSGHSDEATRLYNKAFKSAQRAKEINVEKQEIPEGWIVSYRELAPYYEWVSNNEVVGIIIGDGMCCLDPNQFDEEGHLLEGLTEVMQALPRSFNSGIGCSDWLNRKREALGGISAYDALRVGNRIVVRDLARSWPRI